MHIAIEGLDGVGKTSTAKLLAEKLGYEFVEKPMSFFTDHGNGHTNYLELTDWLNSKAPNTLKACFYGCGNILVGMKAKESNIITDRHLASNYYWNSDEVNEEIFTHIIKEAGLPDLTVILYAPEEVRKQRIIDRNPEDKDINRLSMMPQDAYDKIKHLVEKHNMPYIFLDNSKLDKEQTVDTIISKLKESHHI